VATKTRSRTWTDEERQARRDADRERTREAVPALRAGDGWQKWLGLRRHFRTYSLTNQLLIALAMPDATRVAGFEAWLKLGYCVRRGEKAVIRIWMPLPPSRKQLEAGQAAGSDPAQQPRSRYKLRPVWDRSQVEPLPAPAEPMALDPPIAEPDGDTLSWALPLLEQLAINLGCTLVFEPQPTGCGGSFTPASKIISINDATAVNHQVKTLVHELAHALIHLTDRDTAELSYANAELIVESVVFRSCQGRGAVSAGRSVGGGCNRRGRRGGWEASVGARWRGVGIVLFGGVVQECGGEVSVGVFLGEFAGVGKHDWDGGVADLEAGDEFEQPSGLCVLVVEERAVALLDDDRGCGECGELREGVVERAVDEGLVEVFGGLALDGAMIWSSWRTA
jgi:hypothetical protein